jgi:hypothetical protein
MDPDDLAGVTDRLEPPDLVEVLAGFDPAGPWRRR